MGKPDPITRKTGRSFMPLPVLFYTSINVTSYRFPPISRTPCSASA
jgi:hypothetical protein